MSNLDQPLSHFSTSPAPPQVAIIGGGPAGLMAAEVLSLAGMQVDVYDAMPSLGRKFLRAGLGGLNITHSEPFNSFCSRYGNRQPQLQAFLDRLPPDALRSWVHDLGVETFVGTSGRVFPAEMKAAPLLRSWLHRLRSAGVRLHVNHRWLGFNDDGALRLVNLNSNPGYLANIAPNARLTDGADSVSHHRADRGESLDAEFLIKPQATVLALGGASWPQFGSNAAWVPLLQARGVEIAPLQAANCGFELSWSAHLREKFAGAPVKSLALTFTDLEGRTEQRQGEILISEYGVEGSLIYAFSRRLREYLNVHGSATFTLDLLPGRSSERVLADFSRPRGSRSLSRHLQSSLGISGVKAALLHEVLSKEQFADLPTLAKTIKALPITVRATRTISEAISTAGGVSFDSLNEKLMLKALPGVFVAGEMIDWEAPTGGYLLTACFATGLGAGLGAVDWLNQGDSACAPSI